MVDSTKTNSNLSDTERSNLLNRIDELENLLAKKKAEAQQALSEQEGMPRLKVGTDGIPVLVEIVDDQTPDSPNEQNISSREKDDRFINDIIDKVDKEISEDLDELIVLLKDSIIDEVKVRLMKELHSNKTNPGKE